MNLFLKYGWVAGAAAMLGGVVSYQLIERERAWEEERERRARSTEATVQMPVEMEPRATVDEAELARLRRENAELAQQLEAERAQMKTREAVFNETRAELEELRRPLVADVLSSTLRAELKSGEVVVTGGYKLADGRRLYAFAKPVVEKIDGVNVVKIESRYLTLSDEAGKSVGLDNLATNAANTLQHGEVWVPEEERAVFESLAMTPDTHLATTPSVSVLSGRSATITFGEVQLKVTPTLAAEGDGLGMELRLEQPQTPAAEPVRANDGPAATETLRAADMPSEAPASGAVADDKR